MATATQQTFFMITEHETPPQPEVYKPLLNDLPLTERPTERLETYGASALSTGELLAIVIGGQHQLYAAMDVLAEHKPLYRIATTPTSELIRIQNIGHNTAIRIKAALELGRRALIDSPIDKPQIRSPADAANLVMMEMSALEQEHLRLLLLDTKNHVMKMPTVYIGNLNTSVVRVGELFRYALRENSAGIIVVHNHPSGDPSPSPEDVQVTEKIVHAGKILDIDVLDHLIIGQQRFVSLKERRLGFD